MTGLVSIIVTSYNKENFIQDTLQSILSQTYENIEVIVVDDCSSDNTLMKLDEFKRLPNITIEKNNTNKGANFCRNEGVRIAKGEYIVFFDADDLMHKDCIRQRVNVMTENRGLDFAVFRMGTFLNIIGDRDKVWTPKTGTDDLKCFLSHDLQWATPSPIYKKSFLLKTTLFNEKMTRLQDVEFHTRLLLQHDPKYKLCIDKDPDVFYRVSLNRNDYNFTEMLRRFIKGHIEYLQEITPLVERYKKEYKIYLRLSAFSCVSSVVNRSRENKLSVTERNTMMTPLFQSEEYRELLKGWQLQIIKTYVKVVGYRYIKGIDGIIKKLLLF